MSALAPMENQASHAGDKEGTATFPNRWLLSKLLSVALLVSLSLSLWTLDFSPPPPPLHLNLYLGAYSISTSPPPPPRPAIFKWISVPMPSNFTSTLLSRWLSPGGEPCRDSVATNISLPALDDAPRVELSAAEIHRFTFLALDASGLPRCLGGDYFETDLSGDSWKSRPPVVDHGNGSYSFELQVHPDSSGEFQLSIVLLFRSFQGLKFSPQRFNYRKEVRRIPISFRRSNAGTLPDLHVCRRADFAKEIWSGRWTRHGGEESCEVDHEGRYRCLDPNFPCKKPWCEGPLGALESNGWVYSAHCSFKIFAQDSAWRCLRNKWIFFWGDSNHVDTIRNMLNFILGRPEISAVPRRFDLRFTNPRNESESVRITSVFNGHWNETENYLGLQSLRNEEFKRMLWMYFSTEEEEDRVPDAMVLNSGLHDGIYWKSIRAFAEGAEYAAKFWEEVMRHVVEKRGKTMPRIFYRSTIATGGYARDLAFNPSKMEAFNGVLLEKLKDKGLLSGGGVIDDFDMTFPWHYDNRCNDGVHYGRSPAKARWRDGVVGHQYFVDLMLGHVLLNAVCNE
ncbi:uncharacterized protein [Typha latifolia]|uniref:uncharacterized protein n=1 Tax=Typha latifolia TaxID=4733 RepID=UPI003C2EB96C